MCTASLCPRDFVERPRWTFRRVGTAIRPLATRRRETKLLPGRGVKLPCLSARSADQPAHAVAPVKRRLKQNPAVGDRVRQRSDVRTRKGRRQSSFPESIHTLMLAIGSICSSSSSSSSSSWLGSRGGHVLSVMATRLQSTNQVEMFSGMCWVMSAPVWMLRDIQGGC
jgi:hypothetical protein